MFTKLFEPMRIGSLQLNNRVVMAPMTRSLSPGGVPTPDVAAYYARRAAGGVGLLITEGTWINRPSSGNDDRVPRFYGDDAENGWKAVVDAVHAQNGRIFPQLWHTGGNTIGGLPDYQNPVPYESPSGLLNMDEDQAAVMQDSDIAATIDAFATAAATAKRLGFDGVELHAAHGYLIDQFFWAATNKRSDQFGGTGIGARARFGCDVIKAVRRAVGPEFPISLRISQWKLQDFEGRNASTPQELEAWVAPLAAAGVDMFHCSQRRFWEPEFEGSTLNLAGWVKRITGLPTITVGSVGLSGDFIAAHFGESSEPASLDRLIERLDQNEFDLVAVGRALLSDPEWLSKIRDGRTAELKPYSNAAAMVLT